METAVQKAIETAGGPTKLGALLGISKQAVMQWDRVPADRVLAVEAISGISRYELRPDIFGAMPPPAAPPQETAA